MAPFILTKSPSLVKISFYGVRPHFWAKNGFLGAHVGAGSKIDFTPRVRSRGPPRSPIFHPGVRG